MDAASLSSASSRILPLRQLSKNSNTSCHKRNGLVATRKFVLVANSKQGDEIHEEESVEPDENKFIVLRVSIKKTKVTEGTNYQDQPKISSSLSPSSSEDWNEWEKKLVRRYYEDVFEAVELLRLYLMNTRPSVALGVLALVAITVPLSTSVVFSNALKVARGLLAGCHVCLDIDFLN